MSDAILCAGRVSMAGAALTLLSINERLQTMETHPHGWGGPEALDLQFLHLVELRQKLLRPAALVARPLETRRAYADFVQLINGESTNTFLHCILREASKLDQLPRLLGDFGRWVAQEYPAEVER